MLSYLVRANCYLMFRKAVNPPGTAREDWKIVRALSELADNKLPYDDVYALRTGMGRVAPHLLKDGEREEANFFSEAAQLNQVSSVHYLFGEEK